VGKRQMCGYNLTLISCRCGRWGRCGVSSHRLGSVTR